MGKHVIIPVFIPHKGCPYDCIYCNQKKISGFIEEMTLEKMRGIVDSHLSSIQRDTYVEIGFYGGSFTGIEVEQQIRLLKCAEEYIKDGRVNSIRLSTRPDYINHYIVEYLKNYGVETVELGVQSLDEAVLKKSCRGHSADDVYWAARLIRDGGIKLGIQTMIGLPEDTEEKDLDTAKKVIALKPDLVRIYPALVIKDTLLEDMWYKGFYHPLNLDEAVDICAQLMDLYEENGIQVIRVGLQRTESINEEMDVAAGPFHPAFRQLVEAKRALERVKGLILRSNLHSEKRLVIYTGVENLSNVIGHKKNNVEILKQLFQLEEIWVKSRAYLRKSINVEKFSE